MNLCHCIQGKTCIAYSDVDFFDSEMFEWTQKACSPELPSSPVRMQVFSQSILSISLIIACCSF